MITKRWQWFGFVVIVLPLLVGMGMITAAAQPSATGPAAKPVTGAQQIKGQQQQASPSPVVASKASRTAPRPTKEQLARAEKGLAYKNKINADRKEPNGKPHPVAGPTGGQTTKGSRGTVKLGGGTVAKPPKPTGSAASISPNVPGDFAFYQSSSLGGVPPAGFSSAIHEPSQSASGANVFYTANWYAAVSGDGGNTFSYVDPYANFVGGDPQGFCCDQDVILEPARNVFIWSRLGLGDGIQNNNIDLSVSTDGGNSFCTYAFAGGDISQPNTFLDYPHMSVTNNNLFVTYNVFTASGSFADMGMTRWPLDQLATCSGLTFTFWSDTGGWSWALAQGQVTNTDVQYLGDTRNSAGTFRVYTQSDADTALNFVDRAVPAWTFTNRGGANCPVPSGVNPCARLDQRITGGWTSPEQVGFFWTVAQGGGFPFPYVDAVLINRDDLSVAGQPLIWNPSYGFTYGAAATNAHGDVGINTLLVGGGNYPTACMGIWDDYTAPPPGWQITCPIASDGWDTAGMGDYITVRTYQPASTLFSASSYISAAGTYTGYYFVFGRERDANAWARFALT